MEIIMFDSPRPFGPIFSPKIKKTHSVRVGRRSVLSLQLDESPSLPVAPVRKSPRIRIGRELHGRQFTGSGAKGKPEFIYADD
jgi:hypothetical protein